MVVVVVVVPCNDMVDKRHKNVTNRLTYLSVRDFCNLVNINRAIFGKNDCNDGCIGIFNIID